MSGYLTSTPDVPDPIDNFDVPPPATTAPVNIQPVQPTAWRGREVPGPEAIPTIPYDVDVYIQPSPPPLRFPTVQPVAPAPVAETPKPLHKSQGILSPFTALGLLLARTFRVKQYSGWSAESPGGVFDIPL